MLLLPLLLLDVYFQRSDVASKNIWEKRERERERSTTVDGLRRWFRNAAGFLEAVGVQLLSGTIVEGGVSTTNDVAGRVNQREGE